MRIDRARYLLLTATIASGCGGSSSPAEAPASEPADPAGAPVIDVPLVAEPAADPAETDAEPADEPGETFLGLSPDEHGVLMAHQQAAPTELAAMCRTIRPPPGPYCESIHDTTHSCELYEKVLEPASAKRATECLVHKSGSRALCKFDVAMQCFLQGARAASTKPATSAQCSAVMQRCGSNRHRGADMTMAHCQAAVSAVRVGMERKLLSCISEGCGVGSCLYYLELP